MSTIFSALFLLSALSLIVVLVRFAIFKKTHKQINWVLGCATIIFLILSNISIPAKSNTIAVSDHQNLVYNASTSTTKTVVARTTNGQIVNITDSTNTPDVVIHYVAPTLSSSTLTKAEVIPDTSKVLDASIASTVPSAIASPNGSAYVVPPSSLSLITEPVDGISPIISMINSSKRTVDLVMYELEDTQVEQALAAAAARGVTVRVLLNGGYYGKPDASNPNAGAYSYLQSQQVQVRWAPSYFALTHQKTLVVDGNDALIMTFNLTPQYYSTSRDFGIIDTDQTDISAIETAFAADWNDTKTTTSNGDDLVWSPGSQSEMLSLINSAKSSLLIYNEEMNDSAVTDAIETAAERGVNVEVDMTYDADWKPAFDVLVGSGVHVRTYASNAPLYIHAKMILVDGSQAFVGSENFSPTSLDENRELGIVTTNPDILRSLTSTFNSDWLNGQPYSPTNSSATTTTSSDEYYTSSYHTSRYYYPASCSEWHDLSSRYLMAFDSLQALLAQYPNRTLSPSC